MEFECHERFFRRQEFSNLYAESSILFNWCINLIQENMEFRHSKSQHIPWNKKTKIAELQDPLTKVIVIFTPELKPVAFSTYQITSEPDVNEIPVPCLYCYELQVLKEFRGFGLGSYLVKCIYQIAQDNTEKCHKIMLTAFKSLPRNRLYRSPIDFYSRHGFKPDPISPSQCLKPRESSKYDYEIMSKPVLKNFTDIK